MRTLLLVLVALLLLGTSDMLAQGSSTLYRVPLVANANDTIPGTQSGGVGAGAAGWIYVGDDYVSASLTSQDSVNVAWYIDYADTGYVSASTSSAKTIGHFTVVRTAAADSMCTAVTATWATHHGLLSKVLRGPSEDNIPGASWIRFRLVCASTASKFAAAAADATVSLRVHRIPRFR